MAPRKKATSEEKTQADSNWFFQFWPDIRRQLVVTMFLSISTGVVTIITMYFTQQEMKKDMSKIQVTVNRLDSIYTINNAQKVVHMQNTINNKDSALNILIEQNKELLNQISKRKNGRF